MTVSIKSKTDRILYKALGDQLRNRRAELGYSIRELSRMTGFSRTLIDNWELGLARIKDTQLDILCDFLQITPNIEAKVKIGF